MRRLIPLALLLFTLHAAAADEAEVELQLSQDPVAQACALLAERGNETAAGHLQAMRDQLEMLQTMERQTQGEHRPESETVQQMQRVMREAAEARSWCAAVPLQTAGAPAQAEDPSATREWVRQGVVLAYQRRDCKQVLSGGDSQQKDYQDCQRLRDQLQRWEN